MNAPDSGGGSASGRFLNVIKLLNPLYLKRQLSGLQLALDAVRHEQQRALHDTANHLDKRVDELTSRNDQRALGIEQRLDLAEQTLRQLQSHQEAAAAQLAATEQRLDRAEHTVREAQQRLDATEADLRLLSAELGRIRDDLLPAVVARDNALVTRLADELDHQGSLLERLLRHEPVTDLSDGEHQRLASALSSARSTVARALPDMTTCPSATLDRCATLLSGRSPVLEIGCQKGELLHRLQEVGCHTVGVEADPHLAGQARRLGLKVVEQAPLEAVKAQEPASFEAVCMRDQLTRLTPEQAQQLVAEAARVLKPGGLLVISSEATARRMPADSTGCSDSTASLEWRAYAKTLNEWVQASGLAVTQVEHYPVLPEELADDLLVTQHNQAKVPTLEHRLAVLEWRLTCLVAGPPTTFLVAQAPSDSR